MTFQPRVYDTILTDMIAHVRANTTLTDFSVGSVIRTILEAAAFEDDEQYHQMIELLNDYRYTKASGNGLDERAADFNTYRLSAYYAVGEIIYRDDSLTKSVVSYDIALGVTSVVLDDSSQFPISYPFTVRIGEGTSSVEEVTVSDNNTTTNTLTVSTTINAHSSGDRVAIVTGSGHTVNAGLRVQVPASNTSSPIIFETLDKGIFVAGNYESTVARVKCTQSGKVGNVGVGKITQFVGAAPFTGATVTNLYNTEGGRDRETDDELRSRLRTRISSLSRGTLSAIEELVKGIQDPDTGQQVVSANLVEDFTNNKHVLYIDDGTGFTPSIVYMASSNIDNSGSPLSIGSGSIPVVDSTEFPSSGYVLVSPNNETYAEVLEYTSKDTGVLTLSGVTTKLHQDDDSVLLVDVLPLAEEGQNYFQLSNYPIRENSFQIYDNDSGQFTLKSSGTDYFLNRTNGQIQYYGAGLVSGAQVVGHFNYFTGLVALVQKVVNGSKEDISVYPGVAAKGVIIYVDTSVIRPITVVMSISVQTGYVEADLQDQAKIAIEYYINSLTIGSNIILAKMSQRVMSIEGISNAKVIFPTSDIVILEGELPRSYDSSGESLVSVL